MIRKIININASQDRGDDYKIVIKYGPTWLGKLLKVKPRQREFVGGCTVWHELPRFSRASTLWESFLSDIWSKHEYERDNAPLTGEENE